MTQHTDPRPHYLLALGWVHELAGGVRVDQLAGPTPCVDYDVRSLLGHLVATVERARVIGEGGDPSSAPVVVTGVPDGGWADAYQQAIDKMWSVWSDERRLDAEVIAPWGTAEGRTAVWAYLNETLVHGWDLAVATGQPEEADAEVAEAALAAARRVLPGSPRGGGIPFDPPVEPAAGAGATERLANWSGHHRS